MNNKTKTLLILMTCLVVNSLTGCTTALHGPCKSLSVDLRPNYGKLGPDICLTDRCLGWIVGRNRGPFHHLGPTVVLVGWLAAIVGPFII